MSWCLIIDSDRSSLNGNYFTLPELCRQTAIVLELRDTKLDDFVGLVRNAAYMHYSPTEGLHRHCNFPLSMRSIEGIPSLVLLDDDLTEIASSESIAREEHCGSSEDGLSEDKYCVLIGAGAATAIARKRKNLMA